jgi:hypothetical protein
VGWPPAHATGSRPGPNTEIVPSWRGTTLTPCSKKFSSTSSSPWISGSKKLNWPVAVTASTLPAGPAGSASM